MGEEDDKSGIVGHVEKRIQTANGTKRSFKMEIRLVSDVNTRRKYQSRLHELGERLKTLQEDCKALKEEHNIVDESTEMHYKTPDSLGNTKQLIVAAEEAGMATLEELERQRAALDNLDKKVDRCCDILPRDSFYTKQYDNHFSDFDTNHEAACPSASSKQTDFISIPKKLDQIFESLDPDGA
jgi:phosphopantetheine adenylyltransferase